MKTYYNKTPQIVSAVILVQLFLLLPSEAIFGAVREVPGQYPTIQAAVDAATPGDTILVAPGVYTDSSGVLVDGEVRLVNIHVTKDVDLIAMGSAQDTKIDASGANIAIYVESTSCEIIGFEIITTWEMFGCVITTMRVRDTGFRNTGIRLENSIASIEQCEIHDHGYGVNARASLVFIEENTIHTNTIGIYCENETLGEITHNELYRCGYSVMCESSSPIIGHNDFHNIDLNCTAIGMDLSSPVIRGNHIVSMTVEGIGIGGSNPIIEENTIENCPAGIVSILGDSVIIRNNLIIGGLEMINMFGTTNSEITNNTMIGGGNAIICQNAETNPVIGSNIIQYCTSGIACLNEATPRILCNDIFDVQDPLSGPCNAEIGQNGNIAVDPEFCGIQGSGNYYLQNDSPCAPGNHPDGVDCGLIGSFDVKCGSVPVEETTWGRMKALLSGD